LELYDASIRVAVGNIDDPETYRKMRIDRASLVVATHRDEINTHIAFTAHERPLRSLTHKAGFATVTIGKRKFLSAYQLSIR
jgi:Trk K+ transport system NAD-binding subunit